MNIIFNNRYFKFVWELLIVVLVNLLMIAIFKNSPTHALYFN